MSDISELFNRDPLSLTKTDIDSIIAYYREARAKYLIGDRKAGKTPAAKPAKKAPVNISLDDLEI